MKTKNPAIAIVVGAVVSFAWVSISWMAIPWHQATFSHFKEESAMATAIKAAAEEPGIYLYPSWEDADGNKPQPDVIAAKMKEGPMVFASIVPGGMEMKMGSMMLKGICMHAVAAFVLGFLMLLVGNTFKERFVLAIGVALFTGTMGHLPNWNWWSFPVGFTVLGILDTVIAWTLAGWAMAKLMPTKEQ